MRYSVVRREVNADSVFLYMPPYGGSILHFYPDAPDVSFWPRGGFERIKLMRII